MSTFDLNAVSGIINTQAKEVKTIIATEIAKGTSYNSHKKLATRKAVVDKFTTQTAMGDLFMADLIPDGGIPATQSPVVGFQKTWVQVQGMISTSVSYQNMKFMFTEGASRSEINQGLGQTLKKKVLNLMVGLEKLKDYYMQAQISQGFNTSFLFQSISQTATVPATLVDTTTADGVAFWSENHLREDQGPDWSNVIRTSVPSPVLSEASIAAAHRIHSLKKDATGSPLTSVLDTVIVVRGSQAAQEAKRIKAMLDSGRYPAVTPGVSGSFNEAARIPSFDIIELNYWGTLGLSQTAWGMFDSSMMGEDFGFQYLVAEEGELFTHPLQVNLDQRMTAVTLFQIGMRDARLFMWSAGDEVTE